MNTNTEHEAALRIFEKTGGCFEYISGYENKESKVKVRCLKCGEEIERTYHHLTTAAHKICPVCKANDRQQKRSFKKATETQRKKAERFSRTSLVGMKVCVECGTLFIPKASHIVRCSPECTRRAANRNADSRLNERNVIDKDITLTKLFNRDLGECKICGGRCDWADKQITESGTIVGGNYPTVDHIVPIVSGGLHSWDNVQLAHFRCNTLKRDHIAAE